nr:MAG TPA: hypothetical protein [Caudoviricetes sp.]DAE43456.1 MAG TPA: hypothetical protein [Caudoviricetes sp.]
MKLWYRRLVSYTSSQARSDGSFFLSMFEITFQPFVYQASGE